MSITVAFNFPHCMLLNVLQLAYFETMHITQVSFLNLRKHFMEVFYEICIVNPICTNRQVEIFQEVFTPLVNLLS